MSNQPDIVQKVEDFLRAEGIQVRIYGCGCCGSPVLEYTPAGETKEITLTDVYIDTISDEST